MTLTSAIIKEDEKEYELNENDSEIVRGGCGTFVDRTARINSAGAPSFIGENVRLD